MTAFCRYYFSAILLTWKHWFIGLFLWAITMNVFAATYYSRGSGDFSATATWSASPNGITANATPLSDKDIFIIQSSHTVTLDANRELAQFTVNKGGILDLATFTITVANNWQNDGTISGTTGGIAGNTGTFTNKGSINLIAGQLTQAAGNLINSATGSIVFTGTGTISFGTGNFINAGASNSVNFGSSAIIISGMAASQNIDGFITTGRITCTKSSGRVTFTGNISMNGLTINTSGGAVVDLGSGLEHTSSGVVMVLAGTLLNGSSNMKISAAKAVVKPKAPTGSVPSIEKVNFHVSENQTTRLADLKQ